MEAADAPQGAGSPYRVLARKYRPSDFGQMVGQEALVRTLTNAIRSGRLAHAFMLTGVRGVGKTTTARIIARALNCVGPDGSGGPTVTPCGVCEHCTAIAQDRHVDVMEMDAASRTGVNDIREIIDGVRYGPVSARYKVYIIDEVHMLSTSAFNALLKTLEEPPEHAKFVFATTEIRKVPVTVLSRCQRFDLRRVDAPTLVAHFSRIAEREGVEAEAEAVALIARAADGSVRDGLSLLDQAIALGGGRVTAVQVRDMLGLADRTRVVELFEATMGGRPRDALDILADLHRAGADPVVVMQDLLDLTHFLTRLKVVPETAQDPATPEIERTQGAALAQRLSMPVLSRAWQLLLKGLGEVQTAPVPIDAAEMVIVRLAYAADLPAPADLIRQLQGASSGGVGGAPPGGQGGGPVQGGGGGARASVAAPAAAQASQAMAQPVSHAQPLATQAAQPLATQAARPRAHLAVAADPAPAAVPEGAMPAEGRQPDQVRPVAVPEPAPDAEAALAPMPRTYAEVVALFEERKEIHLWMSLYNYVHPVRCEPGLLEIRPGRDAVPNLAGRVGALLTEWTGRRWMVSVSGAPGEAPLAEQKRSAEQAKLEEASRHPLVRAVLDAFPGAALQLREVADPAAGAAGADGLGDELADGSEDPDLIVESASWMEDEGEF
ncbi:DNA polymerase III subunit gamma/tau [Arenibaculum pallidiluteum]|uniref:DNA polymerase III subunit gamma/tau n=1 Tax=Arenibaculum pallidiluteum TaxID=2812559 RepID=UPI001A96B51B